MFHAMNAIKLSLTRKNDRMIREERNKMARMTDSVGLRISTTVPKRKQLGISDVSASKLSHGWLG